MVKVYKNKRVEQQVLQSYQGILDMWPVDFQEYHIPTQYGLTHCITSGSPDLPPLLLFHGVGDNSAVMWVLNIEELSRHFYCIAVDTLGGPGRSIPNERFARGSFDQAGWINQIINHFQYERVYLAGVSNGAYMAYNYTASHSHKVHKAVCMEGGMVTKPFKTMVQTLLMMFPEICIPTHQNLLRILKKLSSPHSEVFVQYPWLTDHLALLMRSHNQQAMFVHKIDKYNREEGSAAGSQLFFLVGDYRIELQRDFLRLLEEGKFQYKIIPDAGHGINHEQPKRVNAEIVGFLLGESKPLERG
ncbi:alpha/beta fold hydrolase [Paenibacillus bouchesdurhonensis]|uniref:alpha/beta fold hydrolase n=1 Tax=Paenibacillus bouchesdurhonensis TaxID=1870990 RepID=UPI000DA61B22|nr:alpha/beta hydrolase [Paenibacillus bouchesdurhonensis]